MLMPGHGPVLVFSMPCFLMFLSVDIIHFAGDAVDIMANPVIMDRMAFLTPPICLWNFLWGIEVLLSLPRSKLQA